ncbi:TPA: iron-containing redox enzyme family protein [Candidatus Poribacteria bacterium]|nr:iron-containing redox enzyme family protein [Candidatus Poribacteria bacterium]HIN31930.1 iron-containing redox enzyme family protein [Candidatus Poribacteria bacterium]
MNTLIKQILKETNPQMNPYFVSLRNGTFDKDDFVETQIQFYFAVVFFNRPMAAIAAKIPEAELRLEVIRNVWEEHGEGNPSLMHGNTFLAFLDRLAEINLEDIAVRAMWPEVRAFNTTLVGACVMDEYLIGVGVLGFIELIFSDIAGWIGQEIVNHGWISAERLIHYNLHEDLDVKHSDDFFDVLRPPWEADVENRYYIEQGLRLGAFIFNSLYEDLYNARTRRIFRDVRGPHTRAS